MKPYQEIDVASKEAEGEVLDSIGGLQEIADKFAERTGGIITTITIEFIDVTNLGDEAKHSIIGGVEIETSR
jgi:hypothetical protein